MIVVADLLLAPWLKCARVAWRYLDATGISRGEFSGLVRTAARGGDRLGATLEFTPTSTSSTDSAQERRTLISLFSRLRGRQNRIHITNPARRLAGSFPATELLPNNTFENGTTGWTAANGVLAVADRKLRLTTSSGAYAEFYRPVALTQYAPHVLRSVILDGAQTEVLSIGPAINSGGVQVSDYQAARGLRTAVLVASSASAANQFPAVISTATGHTAGAYIEVPWCSLSRCALVDNGPNLLLQSDDFTTTWANTRTTDAANSTTSPDGTTAADSIIEDGSNETHYIGQDVTVPSAAADYAFSVSLKAGTRSFARVAILESTGGHQVYVDVNLSTGVPGAATSGGANWTNPRAFVVDQGDGWYRVTIIGRKASAATVVTPRVYLATSIGTVFYAGNGASLLYAWRGSLAQSSVPVRGVQTTTAAASGTAQTGSAIYVKGLPASTNGLLLPSDEFQIGNELKMVTAALNSDAAGLGYLQFEPPLRTASVNDGPVIIHEPMGLFLFTGEAAGWDNTPGIVTGASAEFEEV